MDVVQRVVAVDDLQRLPDLDAEDVRGVVAALLIERHRLGGRRERVVAESVLHVDEDVLRPRRRCRPSPFRSVSPGFAFCRSGPSSILIGCGAGGVPANVTLPVTLPAVAASIGRGGGWRRGAGAGRRCCSDWCRRRTTRHERDRATEDEEAGQAIIAEFSKPTNYVTLPPASMILRKTRSCIHLMSHHSTGLTGVPLTSTVKCR